MERAQRIGQGGDPGVNCDLLVPASLWGPNHGASAAPATNQIGVHPSYPTHQVARNLHDREPTQQIQSKTAALSNETRQTGEKIRTQVHLLATNPLQHQGTDQLSLFNLRPETG